MFPVKSHLHRLARKQTKGKYNYHDLMRMTKEYAEFKGFEGTATNKDVLKSKVHAWIDRRLGITGAAINWFESGFKQDDLKDWWPT